MALRRIVSASMPPPSSLHLDGDVVAFLLRGQAHAALISGLPTACARRRHLDAVVDRVAHQVHQRIGQRLDQVAVELGVARRSTTSSTCLSQLPGDVAGEFGKPREHPADRLHARRHHRTTAGAR